MNPYPIPTASSRPIAVYLGLCVIWGSTWLGIKYVVADVPPLTGLAVRFWVAVAVLGLYYAVRGRAVPVTARQAVAILAINAPPASLSYFLVYWAEGFIPSGLTSVVFATFPFFVAALSAVLLPNEPWTARKTLGLLCGIAGVGLIYYDQLRVSSAREAVAVVAVLGSALVSGLSVVVIKRWFQGVDAVALTATQLLGCAVLLTVVAGLLEAPLDVRWTRSAALATLYLGVIGTALAFFGYYWLLQRVPGTTVATLTFVTPFVAVLLGWLVADEALSAWLVAGGFLVLTGVGFVVKPGRPVSTVDQGAGSAPRR